jgi:hypothetical protein
MGGVAASSLLARRPRPRPHTATKKHPHHDAQGQSRTVTEATMSPVKPKTLLATSHSPPHFSKNITLTPQAEEERLGPYRQGPADLGPHSPALAPTVEKAGRSSAGASLDRGPPVPRRGPPSPNRGPPSPKLGCTTDSHPATALRCRPWPRAAPAHPSVGTITAKPRHRRWTKHEAPRVTPPPTAPAPRRTTRERVGEMLPASAPRGLCPAALPGGGGGGGEEEGWMHEG